MIIERIEAEQPEYKKVWKNYKCDSPNCEKLPRSIEPSTGYILRYIILVSVARFTEDPMAPVGEKYWDYNYYAYCPDCSIAFCNQAKIAIDPKLQKWQ